RFISQELGCVDHCLEVDLVANCSGEADSELFLPANAQPIPCRMRVFQLVGARVRVDIAKIKRSISGRARSLRVFQAPCNELRRVPPNVRRASASAFRDSRQAAKDSANNWLEGRWCHTEH